MHSAALRTISGIFGVPAIQSTGELIGGGVGEAGGGHGGCGGGVVG